MATAPLSTVQEHPSFPTATQPAQVSTVFNGQPDSRTGNALPDVIIRSSDGIYFAVHAQKLLSISKNEFASLLTVGSTSTTTSPIQVAVEEPADVLNVVLHTVYGLSADAHEPSLQCLRATLQALEKYNITPLDQYITTNTPLFNTILTLATARPFETFGLASQYKLEALAVAVSSRTLTTKMHTMNADVAGTINVVYLQRLYGLHQARRDGMKAINATPVLHDNLPNCGKAKQQETWLDFQYACGTLFMAAPAITREQIETSLNERIQAAACDQCKASLIGERDRIMEAFDALVTTI